MPPTGIVFMMSIPSKCLVDWRRPVERERRIIRARKTRSKGPPFTLDVFSGGRFMKSFARIRSISSTASFMLDLLSCTASISVEIWDGIGLPGGLLPGAWRESWATPALSCGIGKSLLENLLFHVKTWVSWWRGGWETPRGRQPAARGREGKARLVEANRTGERLQHL